MKIKLSKIMAAVTALGVTFAGFTAFAAPVVTTTTEYDYSATDDASTEDVDESNPSIKVITEVTGLTDKTAEVTYFVSDGTADSNIIYIDQQTAVDGSVTFTFSADQDRLVKQDDPFTDLAVGTVLSTAKLGTDSTEGADVLSTSGFTFNPGCNYVSNAESDVIVDFTTETNYTLDDGSDVVGTAYIGKVTGNPSVYGVKLTVTGENETNKGKEYILPALGCNEDGTFVVLVKNSDGFNASSITAEAYCAD